MAQEEKQPYERSVRGLYDRVNISVSALNRIIIVLCILLVAAIAFAISRGGYTVSFDSQGGTQVESQTRMYGELLETPEEPARQGYVFTGWYLDPDGAASWDLGADVVTESLILYAGWAPE